MARPAPSIFLAVFAGALFVGGAEARNRSPQASNSLMPIVDTSPTLAPFQHVRFCLRYPSDCKSDPTENERIDLNAETSELLKRINHSVNVSIIPTIKSYGQNLGDGWTIGPDTGAATTTPSPGGTSSSRAACPRKPCGCRWSRQHRGLAISFLSS